MRELARVKNSPKSLGVESHIPTARTRPWRALLPLLAFGALAVFLAIGLTRDPSSIPTELLDRPVPAFSAQTLDGASVDQGALSGQTALLNVFGSWCTACLVEHPLLMELGDEVRLVGLNWRDDPEDARAWLARHGDPYDLIIADPSSRLAIEFGVTGAPETFVVDAGGTIRFKHTGPISDADWRQTLQPLLQSLSETP